MSKPSKYVIRTSIVEGDKRVRYYFSSRDEARKFCRTHDLPQARIAKN